MVGKKSSKSASETKSSNNVAKVWPCLLNSGFAPFQSPNTWFSINILFISRLFWPGEPLHPFEMGLAFGLMFIVGAFSKLIFGWLADTRPRITLLAITSFFPGLGFFLFGFIPEGGGLFAFMIFIIIIIFREMFTAEMPVTTSYTDDAIEEQKRSQVLGMISGVISLTTVIATLVAAISFAPGWHYYFWIFGGIAMGGGIIILKFGKEPKRGAEKAELKNLLKLDSAVYKYHLTKETIKSTVFSTTNLVAIVEGIFTWMMFAVPLFLVFAYLQSAPYFLSPFSMSLLFIFFVLPGTITGNMLLSKKFDELGNRSIKNRIRLIFGSLIGLAVACIFLVFPLPALSSGEGANIGAVLSVPTFWVPSLALFFGYLFVGVYFTNQKPLLQKINLPEAQGTINAFNVFFEVLATGIGSVLSGALLSFLGNNYQLTALIFCIIGAGGATLWLIGLKRIDGDLDRVSCILKERASQIERETSSS